MAVPKSKITRSRRGMHMTHLLRQTQMSAQTAVSLSARTTFAHRVVTMMIAK